MSTAIASLFTPGINKHFNLRIQRHTPKGLTIFRDEKMSGRVLMRQGWQLYDPPVITLPLNPIHMGEIRESFSSAYTPIKRTLGDLVAEEDWDDDEYGVLRRVIPARAGAMADIFAEKLEYDLANYLAVTAYSAASPAPHSPDGVSLANSAHPMSKYNSATTWSNVTSTPVALSHTVYYTAYASLSQQLAPNNYTIIESKPELLWYNPTQRAIAVQLAKGDWERGLSTFNMNAAKEDNLHLVEWAHFRKTLSISAANSFDGWGLAGPNHSLVFANRATFKAKSDYSINQQAFIFVGYCRYDLGHDDPRGTYFPAA